MEFLGFILSVEGIRPNPDKLDVIRNFEEPKNRRELQQVIEVCTYYRQFSVRHANLIDPFRPLLKSKSTWVWTPEHSHAFKALKNTFADSITLRHILPDAPFKLQTDASDKGISGILYQTDCDGEHRIISLVSRCLNSAEINYNTTEKELLAIVYSIAKCRTYLARRPFLVITDHEALTFLNTTTFHTARLARWSIYIQQYTFEVQHCTGRENQIADFFSRNPVGKFEPETNTQTLIVAAIMSHLTLKLGTNPMQYEIIARLTRKYDEMPADIRRDLDAIAELQQDDP